MCQPIAVTDIEESEEWKCFECDPVQLRTLRLLFYSIWQFWIKVDEKIKKRETAKAKKNRTDCITKTIHLAEQNHTLSRRLLSKKTTAWRQNPDFDSPVEKFKAAEGFAKFLALSQKNINQLKEKFFEYLEEDIDLNKTQKDQLNKVIVDLDSISNGHLEEIVVKKEKVKYEVLQSSDDEPVRNGGT